MRSGQFDLIDTQGKRVREKHDLQYIGDRDELVDLTGDGIPEWVHLVPMGTAPAADSPAKAFSSVEIRSLAPGQRVLLGVRCDSREYKASERWRWKCDTGASPVAELVFEKRLRKLWKETARYRWNADDGRFDGPEGSHEAGFVAVRGAFDKSASDRFTGP